MCITLYIHVSQFHNPRLCQIYSMGPSNKLGTFIYYSYIHALLGNVGGIILLALCTRITIHPNNIHTKNCSSQYYYLKLLKLALLIIRACQRQFLPIF